MFVLEVSGKLAYKEHNTHSVFENSRAQKSPSHHFFEFQLLEKNNPALAHAGSLSF